MKQFKQTFLAAIILSLSLGACKDSKDETTNTGAYDTRGAEALFVRIRAHGATVDYSSTASVRLRNSVSSNSVSLLNSVYASDIQDQRIRSIQADANQGTTTGTFTTVKDVDMSTAALGADNQGWLYYIKYGQGGESEGSGKIDIYATKADGTGSPTRIVNNFDVNGAYNWNDLGFVRLGVDKQNVGWILAKSLSNNTICLAKFNCNGNSTTGVNPSIISTNITTSDNSSSVFDNGDLCFDGLNFMYALGNDAQTGITKIYTIDPRMSTVLTYKWTLKTIDGNNFAGSVNGAAFSSTGSMFVSTSGGLHFIDQFSTNFSGTGTVKCEKVKDYNGLSDLATAYWPGSTNLPVTFTSLSARKDHDQIITTFKVADVDQVDTYYLEFSIDGVNFITVKAIAATEVQENQDKSLSMYIK